MKVALVQMNSREDKAANMAEAERLVRAAIAAEAPDLVVLPEYWACLSPEPAVMHASGEAFPEGEAYALMRGLAREHGVAIHAGSMVERAGNRYHNTSVVFGRDGAELARYRKIHLFDVEVPGGACYRESDSVTRGEQVVTYRIEAGGEAWTLGAAICYDLRFPELFQALRDAGAEAIILPAAFTLQTGKDHWELLARARACETQSWFLAVGQIGTHGGGGKACWGHSMAIDPWGAILSQMPDRSGFIGARLDKAYMAHIRLNLPVEQHHVLTRKAA
ncbi:carbon-nitrogen hydrolase family protein [Roseomonas sp. GC11]|uniref:carbon-nitrogen hydrolase family protein n=1 Tax=Roseomonas sp. GC11 TaxID=2950546 RepID=UPI00210B97BF|nr:carbon-nitrogen hydrolase family protein [Roseomonas sp. GC11]MCQ4161627.1 carbon-nitrogen hydrolase family protein [Roseomonas sp. GC11]